MLSSAEIVSKIFGFVATVYLARVLGPFNFGVISFAAALLIYFGIGSSLGLDNLGARMIARDRDKAKSYFQQIVPLKFILSLIFFLLLICLILLIDKSPLEKKILLLFSLTIFPSALLIEWVFQGLEKFNWVGASRILTNLLYFITIIVFVKSSGNVFLVPVFRFISVFLSALLLFIVFYKYYGLSVPRIDLSAWKKMLSHAWPMGLYSIMVMIISNLDLIMIGFMRTNEEVGYYNAAYRFIWMLVILLGAYLQIIYPTLSYLFKTSLEAMQRVAARSLKLILTFVIPTAVGGTILASRLIFHVFGSTYLAGTLALQILFWTMVFISINSVMVYVLLAANREKKCVKAVTTQAIINLILNLIFIPRYGIYGAAWATLAAEFVGLFLYFYFLSPVFRLNYAPFVLRPLISAAVMGSILYFLGLKIYFAIPFGAMIYFACLIVLGGISREEVSSVFGYVFNGR